jgi:hypothetical protein
MLGDKLLFGASEAATPALYIANTNEPVVDAGAAEAAGDGGAGTPDSSTSDGGAGGGTPSDPGNSCGISRNASGRGAALGGVVSGLLLVMRRRRQSVSPSKARRRRA